jgi:hypothetical protein
MQECLVYFAVDNLNGGPMPCKGIVTLNNKQPRGKSQRDAGRKFLTCRLSNATSLAPESYQNPKRDNPV